MRESFSLCLASAVSHTAAPSVLQLQINAELGVNFAEIAKLNDRALQFFGHSQTNQISKIILDDINQTIAVFHPVLKFTTVASQESGSGAA